MNVLDENIPDSQRQLLRKLGWIRVRQIGNEISRQEISDEEITPLLHHAGSAIFFSNPLIAGKWT